jgi:hypothetical protein
MILDSTCSTLKRWPQFADVRMDIKPEVKPDLVADAKHLPFQDHIFDEIYCDPPHLIRKDLEKWGDWGSKRNKDLMRFGAFKTRPDWISFLYRVNNEFKRTLTNNGHLHFKVADGKDDKVTKLRDLDLLTNFLTERDESFPSKAPWSKNTTHFLEMKPN